MKLIIIITFLLIIILFAGRDPGFSKSNIDPNTAKRLEHIPIEKELIPKLKEEIEKLRDKLLKFCEKGPGEPIKI